MNILIVGGAGYVGTTLTENLLEKGHKVTVLDTFWYWKSSSEFIEFFVSFKNNLTLIEMDLRDLRNNNIQVSNFDVVVHLACVSNDPSFDLNPKLGESVNLHSFINFVDIVKNQTAFGKKTKLIFASSSSVYGVREEDKVNEELEPMPLTDYSKYKLECEKILRNNSDFIDWIILRPATVCGWSKRMRLDLVVNILTYSAIKYKNIIVHGGAQYRPNIHILDMVEIYTQLCSDFELFSKGIHKIYNVGGENVKLIDIAKSVKNVLSNESEIKVEEVLDPRSYRIDSTKIKNELGFYCKKNINDAVSDISLAFRNKIERNEEEFYLYNNIKTMSKLIEQKKIKL